MFSVIQNKAPVKRPCVFLYDIYLYFFPGNHEVSAEPHPLTLLNILEEAAGTPEAIDAGAIIGVPDHQLRACAGIP
jgi:hypothetical protein